MTVTLRRTCLLLATLAVASARAQDAEEAAAGAPPKLTVTRETAATTRITLETPPIPITVRMEYPESASCGAVMSLSFQQRDTIARVEGELENRDCAASSGEYILAISVAAEDGTRQTLEFNETWQREDDQSYIFEGDYPIGENVELVGARTRALKCTCTTPLAPEPVE